MARSGYDKDNIENFKAKFIDQENLVAHSSPLGHEISDYMVSMVTKILYAKNMALQKDNIYQQIQNIDENASQEKLQETYLKKHIIEDADGKPISDIDEMRRYVQDNFYFCLSDQDTVNAWIYIAERNPKSNKNAIAFTTKMLEFSHNAGEFEGIISHELGHFFVAQKYGEEAAAIGVAINETLADKHAVDCLYYMGKNPNDYSHVVERLNGLDEMTDLEKLRRGLDRHGTPYARLQNIIDYNEASYGEYIDDLMENEEAQKAIDADDVQFNNFKASFKELYPSDCYAGKLELAFMQDPEFAKHIDKKTGKIDFSHFSYEKVLDKLNETVSDEFYTEPNHLEIARQIILSSNHDNINYTPELIEKINRFLCISTNAVALNMTDKFFSESEKEIYNKNLLDNIRTSIGNNSSQSPQILSAYLFEKALKNGENITSETLTRRIEAFVQSHEAIKEDNSFYYVIDGQVIPFTYTEKKFLLFNHAESPLLTEEERKNRLLEFPLNNRKSPLLDIEIDRLSFTLCYPDIDIDSYENKLSVSVNKKEIQRQFFARLSERKLPKIQPVPLYQSSMKYIQNFIDGGKNTAYKDNIYQYSHYAVDLPSFEMPEEKDAIGKKLPWFRKDGEYNSDVLERTFGLKLFENAPFEHLNAGFYTIDEDTILENNVIYPIKFPNDQKYDFAANDEGIIIATGERAKELNIEKARSFFNQKSSHISEIFHKKLEVLNALSCVAVVQEKEKTSPLSAEEILQKQKSLEFLINTPDIERYLVAINYYGSKRNPAANNLKDYEEKFSYSNMPDFSEFIKKDMQDLKESYYFQHFSSDDIDFASLSAKEKIDFMDKAIQMSNGKNTVKTLDSLAPVILHIMEERAPIHKNIDENFSYLYDYDNKQLILRIYGIQNISDLSAEEIKSLYRLKLDIKSQCFDKKKDSLIDVLNYEKKLFGSIGTNGDEVLYTHERVKYYELMREKYHMQETDNHPEVLYDNLTSTFSDYSEIGTDYQNKIIESNIKKNIEIVGPGSQKLNCFNISGEYKLAEYEVSRYLNNPDNPPLDIKKLLESYPKYDLISEGISLGSHSEFRELLSSYVLKKSNFKSMNFEQKKEIYDLMLHKNLFDKNSANKFEYLEELKKSYIQLPEAQKEAAAHSMLLDKEVKYNDIFHHYSLSLYEYEISEKTELNTTVDYPPIRNYFIEEYATYFSQRIGKEPSEGERNSDGTEVSVKQVKKYQDDVVAFMNDVNSNMTQADIKEKLFIAVADKIEAQKDLADKFGVAVKHIDRSSDLSDTNNNIMKINSTFQQFAEISPQTNLDMIDFLTTPYSLESAQVLREKLFTNTAEAYPHIIGEQIPKEEKEDLKNGVDNISNEDLAIYHGDFWEKNLNERTAVMQRLLYTYAKNDTDLAVKVVLDKYLQKDQPYYHETEEILNTLYERGSGRAFYRHDKVRFMLGAMLSVQKPSDDNSQKNIGIGKALALFCSNNGPAWVKFGQALSNIPDLPDDIRQPLSVLKDNAVTKTRWQLFAELEENLPPQKMLELKHIGKVLGAGSFFSSIAVDTPKGGKEVVQILQPNASKNAQNEFKKIMRTIHSLINKDKRYAVLDTIVKRAYESAQTEVDISRGFNQYVEADKNYNMIDKLEVNGVNFKLNLSEWTDHYQTADGNGYKQMKFAEGKPLNRLDCSAEEKRILAAGYASAELAILLSGRAWDIDRHGGQQNFMLTRDENGKISDVKIGIYDTGALRHAPTDTEKKQIASFYAHILKASVRGENVTDVMFQEVRKLEEKGVDASYVSDIQRGCIALADICEYQKEERDAQGNILKQARSLNNADFVSIMTTALRSGMSDHKIVDETLHTLIKDKQFLKSSALLIAQKGVNKAKRFIGKKFNLTSCEETNLKIIMEAKGILQTKEENAQIEQKNNTSENEYSTPKRKPLNKAERAQTTDIDKKEHHLVRNMQALYLKKSKEEHSKKPKDDDAKEKIRVLRGVNYTQHTQKAENTGVENMPVQEIGTADIFGTSAIEKRESLASNQPVQTVAEILSQDNNDEKKQDIMNIQKARGVIFEKNSSTKKPLETVKSSDKLNLQNAEQTEYDK